jgi:hypothetical protein
MNTQPTTNLDPRLPSLFARATVERHGTIIAGSYLLTRVTSSRTSTEKTNMKNDSGRTTNDLSLQLPSSPPGERIVHTQNSVERNRPQNKYLKPFKSRAELGGQLDPRINKGGRPKGMSKAYTRWLAEVDPATGESNADKLAKAQIARACNPKDPGSTAAAREIRKATEGD